MNENDLLKKLNAATDANDSADGQYAPNGSLDNNELSQAWRRLTAGLRECDVQLNADRDEFTSRILTSLSEGVSVEPAQQPSIRKAAIVACGQEGNRPASRNEWLALLAVVALFGLGVWSFDWGKDSPRVARTEIPAPHGAGHANRGATSPAYADQVVEATAGGATARGLSLPEWTDSVDDAIAEANQQLVAMHGSSNWDRSVQALERYRQSVEQEMNEWEL